MKKLFATRFLCASSSFALTLAMPAAGHAQTAPADESSNEQQAQEIIVTSSRLQNAGFDAPTPVSVMTEAEIQRAAPATISDFVNQMPALSGSNTPRTNKGAISNGLAGGNFLNLRNLGTSRTLVLMNGKRVTPATLTGVADVNTLPTPLIKRVDVVTGGASAAWGSDAVAGVVNFVLDKDYVGLKGSVQGGVTTVGDGGNVSGDLSFGKSFSDGRGHVLISGQYSKNNEALFRNRDWFKAYKVVPNPNAGAPGESTLLAAPWATILANNTGLIASGPLAGYYFDANGNLAGTNFPLTSATSIYSAGDKAIYDRLQDQSRYGQASTPLEQYSVFGRLSYDLSDAISIYAEGNFAKSKASALVANYWLVGNTSVSVDNYYLPDQVRQAMIDAGVTSLPLSIANTKMGIINSNITRKNYRALAGLEGTFGSSWHWDVSYQYGRTDSQIRATGMPRPGPYALAIDAVDDPSNPGNPICRSTLTDPTNGCIPMNPFGSQALSAAQLANVVGVSSQDIRYEQNVASANLSGTLVELPAGNLSFAAGAEYRSEKAVAKADPISQATGFWAGNFKDFSGKYNVKEAYAEIGVPVLEDSAVGKSLDLNFAGRWTDYSTSGSVVTWKAGLRYEPISGVEIRATRSRDIRAPNLQELFQPGLITNQAVTDPENGNASIRMIQTLSGNINLKPEKADTLTAGIVFQPAFASGLRASVDYYDIKIKDAIATNSSQFIVDRCFEGLQVYCSAITRDSNNQITAVNLQPFNALQEQARGIDIEVSYTMPVGQGDLALRVLANYVDKLNIVSPDATIRRAGEVGNNVGAAEGVPHWRGIATATYAADPITFQLKGRMIGSAKVDDNWDNNYIDHNHVPAIFYLDAYLGIKAKGITSNGEFFLAADNIFNQDPPVVTPSDNANTVASGTNLFMYDVLGTTLRAGFRFEF